MVLIVLLLAEGMVAGMLALATHVRVTTAAQLRTARAEAAAYAATQIVLRGWQNSGLDTLSVGAPPAVITGGGPEPDLSWSSTVERIQSHYLVRTEAFAGMGPAAVRSRVLAAARSLDRAAVSRELVAALVSGGQVVAAGNATLSAIDTLCPGAASSSAGALATTLPPILAHTTTVTGALVVDSTLRWSDSLAVGNLTWGEIAAVADRTESGTVTPTPSFYHAACDTTARANWGDPLQPASPCGPYAPLVFAPGDLIMAGGAGQGVLVVRGVLAMSGDAAFSGVIAARDGVTIGPLARVYGGVVSRQGYALIDDAAIVHSPCTVSRVLVALPAARRLVPEKRRFLPVF